MKERIRTIVTQDAEIDDQNSLRHFLLCSNQVEVQGIIQTSSVFHWIGVKGKETPPPSGDPFGIDPKARFDQCFRWPGTDWMAEEISDYEEVYPLLCRHAEGYPTPEYLRSITKVGNIGYPGEMDAPSEGSELIRSRILDSDPRTLYIQVWGGTNTIARALLDIENEYSSCENWKELHAAIEAKVVLTACGEQDDTYRSYIAEKWPNIKFVKCLQMMSYAYPWRTMPHGESFDTLCADFMQREILSHKAKLIQGYATWMDGKLYEGEESDQQFGQDGITDIWFGRKFGLPDYEKYDFLSEGDSPTYFCLMDWGFRTLEDFAYGGISGRYVKKIEKNSKGEALDYYDVTTEGYLTEENELHEVESMWRYTAALQKDFAARCAWTDTECYEDAEHPPIVVVEDGCDRTVCAGDAVTLRVYAYVPSSLGAESGEAAGISWRFYPEAGSYSGIYPTLNVGENTVHFTVPSDALPGQTIHLIAEAIAPGHLSLRHFAQIIFHVTAK